MKDFHLERVELRLDKLPRITGRNLVLVEQSVDVSVML
jgi:hypothetical protein